MLIEVNSLNLVLSTLHNEVDLVVPIHSSDIARGRIYNLSFPSCTVKESYLPPQLG